MSLKTPEDFPLQLQVNLIHNGKVIGTFTKGINDDILGFTRERNFQLVHSFEAVSGKAVAEACENFDKTNEAG